MSKWSVYVWERFPPLLYIPFIAVFSFAHALILTSGQDASELFIFFSCISILFFFSLRLFDELKDYTQDILLYPERPLSRGLISLNEVHTASYISVGGLCILAFVWNSMSMPYVFMCMGYLFLMYHEFFITKWLRPRLTIYAITHTAVVVAYSWMLYALVPQDVLRVQHEEYVLFTLAGWMLFTLFEFARKTYASAEERRGISSYSKLYGRAGATMLSSVTLTLAVLLLAPNLTPIPESMLWGWVCIVYVSGLAYALQDRKSNATLYRTTLLASIVGAYICIIMSNY